MGLDMYLDITRTTSQYDVFRKDGTNHGDMSYEESQKIGHKAIGEMLEPHNLRQFMEPDNYAKIAVTTQAMYWRKANHIHQWFVENCQDGVDQCQRSYVSVDQLKQLRDECQAILDAHEAGEDTSGRLDPQSGFFFGSTEKDEWYWQDTRRTAERLTHLLDLLDKLPEDERYLYDFYYQASW